MESSNNPNSFQLDNRTTTELLQFISAFAKQVSFVSDDEKIVHWEAYLAKNPIFLLVPLTATTPKEFLENFKHAEDKTSTILGQLNHQITTLDIHYEEEWFIRTHQIFKHVYSKVTEKLYSEINAITKDELNKFTDEEVLTIYHTLKQIANDCFTKQSNHAPDIALLVTFVKLYKKYLLPDLNKLPQKLTQLYYESILGKKKLAPVPDTAHIYFQPAKHIKTELLEKGIKLYAGRDANNNVIEFETKDSVQISQARLEKIQTLHFVNTDNKVSLTGGVFQNIQIKKEKEGIKANKYFETFGTDISIYRKPLPAEIATLGFAISSPLFFLKEGSRTISVFIPIHSYDKTINLAKELKKNCAFQITTPTGWVSIINSEDKEDKLKIQLVSNVIHLEFILDDQFDPIDKLDNFSKDPAIRCIIKNEVDKRTSIYKDLKSIQINGNRIRITVEVKGKNELTCYNDLGILNIGQPFQPFGATPTRHSKFIIGDNEVFQKPIDSLKLYFNWNLPNWNFRKYFEAYNNLKIKKHLNYEVKLNFIDDRIIIKEAENKTKPHNSKLLFNLNKTKIEEIEEVEDFDENKTRTRTMLIEEGTLRTSISMADEWQEELPEYSNFSNWGFLILELINPKNPFGTGLYQNALTNSIQSAMNLEINPPMIPELTNIKLDYTASNQKGAKYNFYHIHPFGVETLSIPQEISLFTRKYEYKELKKGAKEKSNSEQDYEYKLYNGFLFLGIDNLSTGILSIYFELASSSLIPSDSNSATKPPKIFFIKDNEFIPLRLVSDTTASFEQTGIIKINIEESLLQSNNNTIVPNTLFWIAIGVEKNTEYYSLTSEIQLHGVSSIRSSNLINNQKNSTAPIFIEANTIQRTLNNIPSILKIHQPFPSFQGRLLEQDIDYRKRIANQLKHRNRPTKKHEIEAIILEQFSEIHKIKVIPKGNEIRIIVIPQKREKGLLPSFPISFLEKVKNFLEQIFPPFLSLRIENPHYAIIQTHSFINLKSGQNIFDKKQITAQITKSFIEQFLNPWEEQKLIIGKVPDFLKIKLAVEAKYPLLSFEDFKFYYYYLIQPKTNEQPIPRRFSFFEGFNDTYQPNRDFVFVPDEDEDNHQIFFKIEDWLNHKQQMETKEYGLRPILGYHEDAAFDRVRKPLNK